MAKIHVLLSSFKTIFGIDLRTLALFRISLATMILVDLALRARDIGAFFTDEGVLTRAQSMGHSIAYRWSLHWINGTEWAQVILFIVAATAALLLLVGYRTRIMVVLSWVFLLSIQNRNELLTTGGDNLLLLMVFWAMFLPIGARFSVDAALNSAYQKDLNARVEVNHDYCSIASVAVLLQVAYLYFFTAILKTGDSWRVTMDAAFYAIHIDQLTTIFGHWMRNFPALMHFGTYYVWYLEVLALFLLFSPIFYIPLRLITLALLILMHAAFLACLYLVLFPFIDLVSLTLFVPGVVWVWLAKKTQREHRKKIRIYYDQDCGFCRKTCLVLRTFLLPASAPILPAQSETAIHEVMTRENSWVIVDPLGQQYLHWSGIRYLLEQSFLFKPIAFLFRIPFFLKQGNALYHWVANHRYLLSRWTERWLTYRPVAQTASWLTLILAGFFLYIITYINVTSVDEWDISKPSHVFVTEQILRLDQRWDMFAPFPYPVSAMAVMPGRTRNGQHVDAYRMTLTPAHWEWPKYLSLEFKNYRWRKYIERLRLYTNHVIHQGYASYLCRRWNKRDIKKENELASFEIYFELKKTQPNGEKGKPERYQVWRQWCFDEYAPDQPLSFFN